MRETDGSGYRPRQFPSLRQPSHDPIPTFEDGIATAGPAEEAGGARTAERGFIEHPVGVEIAVEIGPSYRAPANG